MSTILKLLILLLKGFTGLLQIFYFCWLGAVVDLTKEDHTKAAVDFLISDLKRTPKKYKTKIIPEEGRGVVDHSESF